VDFVVAGLGLGALIVVVGFVVRDLGPLVWRFISHRSSDEDNPEQTLWNGLCQSISMVLTIAGAVILLATVVAIALGLSDHLGSRIVIIVSVAAVLAAAVLLALNVRDYRAEVGLLSSAELAYGRNSGREFSSSMTTSITTNSLNTVRPVRKPEDAVVAAEVVPGAVPSVPEHDPHLVEPFDATKLLASEFDHHEEIQQTEPTAVESSGIESATPEVEEIAMTKAEAALPAVTESGPEIVVEEISRPEQKVQLEIVKPAPSEDTVVSSVFRSPLLADIGVAAAPSVVGFESSLLADVEVSTDEQTAEFVSPLFADLVDTDAELNEESVESDQSEASPGAEDEADQSVARKR